jgi:ACDE family multidrug resistance protein
MRNTPNVLFCLGMDCWTCTRRRLVGVVETCPLFDLRYVSNDYVRRVPLFAEGNGKLITRSKREPTNPVAYLGRFFQQPRLIAGWLFAVIRSCGWWAYVVYLPIFAVENGLGDSLGGILLSATNAALFLSPIMLRWMQKRSVRYSVQTGFAACAILFTSASIAAAAPTATIALLFAGSFFLILLDICAGLPFLMAVKPSERTEMSAVYSSYRDVSGILTPGVAWLILLTAPISGIFAAAGIASLLAWGVAGRLHPRLGEARLKPVAISTFEQPVLEGGPS